MSRAKAPGRTPFCFHTGDLDEAVVARLERAGALCQALARDELVPCFQPKIEAAR